MIKNICEILVDRNVFENIVRARRAVKSGSIYINGYRVADTKALIVITERVIIEHREAGSPPKVITVNP